MDKLERVYNKFSYDSVTNFDKLEKSWIEDLGIVIHPDKDTQTNFIEVPPIDLLLKNLSKSKNEIKTDCRFFAMLMGCLKNNPDKKNIFIMPKNHTGLEIMIPEGCLYITLNIDKFVIETNKDRPPSILSKAFKTDQGQWIVKFGEDSYLGIVDEGPIIMSLNEWINRYKKCVEKHLGKKNKDEDMKIYFGLLSCLIHKHGIDVGVYSYDRMGKIQNILKYN